MSEATCVLDISADVQVVWFDDEALVSVDLLVNGDCIGSFFAASKDSDPA